MQYKETTITYGELFADEGKVFMRKKDREILSGHIVIGNGDDVDNYVETDTPSVEEPE